MDFSRNSWINSLDSYWHCRWSGSTLFFRRPFRLYSVWLDIFKTSQKGAWIIKDFLLYRRFKISFLQIQWKQVLSGLALQFVFGLAVLRWEIGRNLFTCLGDRITRFLDYTLVGSDYVFGYLATDKKNEQFDFLNAFGFRVITLKNYSSSKRITYT